MYRRSMVLILVAILAGAVMPARVAAQAASALASGSGPPELEFAFEAVVTLRPTVEVGSTPYGIRRRVAITGGTVSGPRFHGTVLPGGADWQLQRADQFTVLEADYMIELDDGTLIHVVNRGLSNFRVAGNHPRYVRTAPVFEAPNGPYAWLNESLFVATLDAMPGNPVPAVRLRFYRLK